MKQYNESHWTLNALPSLPLSGEALRSKCMKAGVEFGMDWRSLEGRADVRLKMNEENGGGRLHVQLETGCIPRCRLPWSWHR